MSIIILEPKWLFHNKPAKVERNVYEKDFSQIIELDRGTIEIWTGRATLYGEYIRVFSVDQGESWRPVLREDGKMLL